MLTNKDNGLFLLNGRQEVLDAIRLLSRWLYPHVLSIAVEANGKKKGVLL